MGQLSLCSQVLLLPLGVLRPVSHSHDSEVWTLLTTSDVRNVPQGQGSGSSSVTHEWVRGMFRAGGGGGAEAWSAGQPTHQHQKNRPQEEIEICTMHASAFTGWLRDEWRGYITLAASGVITGSIGIGFVDVQNVMPPKTTG